MSKEHYRVVDLAGRNEKKVVVKLKFLKISRFLSKDSRCVWWSR